MKKTLIAVYSQTGQSMHIAHILQKKISADIYEIIPDRKYNDNMWKAWDEAQDEIKNNTYPGLTNTIPDLCIYDTIIVGGPVWGMTLANPVITFMRNVNLEGKTVSSFWTFYDHDEKYDHTMCDMSKGAHYITGLPLPRFVTGNVKKLESVIDEWVQTITEK